MMISTKGRYAVRIMVDLAEHSDGANVPLKEMAQRQEISQKYLEQIMAILVRGKLVEGAHGKGGGYVLTRDPSDYKIGEILRLTEGDLNLVPCLEDAETSCPRAAQCRTYDLWQGLAKVINEYLDSITLADLMKKEYVSDYII